MDKIKREIIKADNLDPKDSIFELESGEFIYCGGWNGEKWFNCFHCFESGYPVDSNESYFEVSPVYKKVDEDQFDLEGLEF